jgi:hypothetical protein
MSIALQSAISGRNGTPSAVVAEITARIERLVGGFPEEVKQAWAQTRGRQTAPHAVGALPAPRK